MRAVTASSLSEVDPIDGFRFWGRQPFSRELVKPLEAGDESNNQKPISGLWLSPLLHGHTDCWQEFLDGAGWHGRLPHRVEVDPDMPVLVLDSAEDLEEYDLLFCSPGELIPQLRFFDPAKYLELDAPALYISRQGVRNSKRSRNTMGSAWDVPSLWINDPLGVYLQQVEPEDLIPRSHS